MQVSWMVPLVFVLALVSPPALWAADAKADGELVLRGVFFGQGPVAALFPELWRNPRLSEIAPLLWTKEVLDLQNRVVARVEQEHPGFLAWFGWEARSGDHVRVRDAVTVAAERLREAVGAVTGADVTIRHGGEAADVSPAGLVLGPVAVVAAFAAVAFAVEAYSIVDRVIGIYRYAVVESELLLQRVPTVAGGGALAQDMAVDMFARRLAAR